MDDTKANELGLFGLLDMARAGLRSQVLYAANVLGVFGTLSGGPQSAEQLAPHTGVRAEALRRLLDTCAALGLLRKTKGSYANSVTSETYLVPGRPDYVGDAVEMFRWRVAPILNDLTGALRELRSDSMYDHALMDHPDLIEQYIAGLRQLGAWRARALALRVDLSKAHRLVDVGAGSGVYALEIVKRNPHLSACLFDQPPMCEIAKRLVGLSGLSARVEIVAGDFFRDKLPRGDVLLFSNVLHDFPPERVRYLLRKAFDALEPGGMILVNDFILEDDGTAPTDGVMMSLVFFLEAEGAGNYSASQYRIWLKETGFDQFETLTLHGSERVACARKPFVEA